MGSASRRADWPRAWTASSSIASVPLRRARGASVPMHGHMTLGYYNALRGLGCVGKRPRRKETAPEFFSCTAAGAAGVRGGGDSVSDRWTVVALCAVLHVLAYMCVCDSCICLPQRRREEREVRWWWCALGLPLPWPNGMPNGFAALPSL